MCVKNDILSALAYIDIFDYPLKRREITLFLPNIYPEMLIKNGLDELIAASAIFRLGEFFSLRDKYELEKRRKSGNEKATERIATAEIFNKFNIVRSPLTISLFI